MRTLIFVLAMVLGFLFHVSPSYAALENESHASFFVQDKMLINNNAPVKNSISKKKHKTIQQYNDTQPQRTIGGDLIASAQQFIGATARELGLPRRLWCADFMNMLVGGSDRRAASYTHRGSPAPYGCTNCVAVTTRRGGGHVGIVQGYDERGNPIIISGNHGHRVGVGTYSKRMVIAYRYV